MLCFLVFRRLIRFLRVVFRSSIYFGVYIKIIALEEIFTGDGDEVLYKFGAQSSLTLGSLLVCLFTHSNLDSDVTQDASRRDAFSSRVYCFNDTCKTAHDFKRCARVETKTLIIPL